jgi:hypothetical protein
MTFGLDVDNRTYVPVDSSPSMRRTDRDELTLAG